MYGKLLTKPLVGCPVAMTLFVAKLPRSSKGRWQWTTSCPYISQCLQNNYDTLVRVHMHLIYPVLYMLGEVTKAQQEAVRKLQVISHKDEAPMVKVGVREGMMMRSIVRSDHAKGANTHAWERYGYAGCFYDQVIVIMVGICGSCGFRD